MPVTVKSAAVEGVSRAGVGQAETSGRPTAPATSSSAGRRGARPSSRPPLPELELLLWGPHAHAAGAWPAVHVDGAEELGGDDGDVLAVLDGADAREVRFAEAPRAAGDTPPRATPP